MRHESVCLRRYNHEFEDKQIALRCSHDPEDLKIYHKKLYSEPNPIEGEIKEDQNPGGVNSPRGQRLDALCSRQADMERYSSTGLNQVLVVVPHK
jgi:hypothetical protein